MWTALFDEWCTFFVAAYNIFILQINLFITLEDMFCIATKNISLKCVDQHTFIQYLFVNACIFYFVALTLFNIQFKIVTSPTKFDTTDTCVICIVIKWFVVLFGVFQWSVICTPHIGIISVIRIADCISSIEFKVKMNTTKAIWVVMLLTLNIPFHTTVHLLANDDSILQH